MSVKTLKILSIMCVALSFSACSNKELVYVDRPIEVKIPVKCEVPKVECNFNQTTDTEVIQSLYICAKELKRSIEVCSK